MRTRVGQLSVEITRPESAKFHHALLLLHGLWTGGWIWDRFASHLAHRGWESWVPALLERTPGDHDSTVDVIEEVARALPMPPVIVAHDVGVVAAALLASRMEVPAVVAVAPVVAPADAVRAPSVFTWPRYWRVRVAGARVRPPRGTAARAFLGPQSGQYAGRLVADFGPAFRALAANRARLPASLGCPGLVLSGALDPVSPPEICARLAARFGWSPRAYPGRGHLTMLEPGWEQVAGDIHRWIVQTLGAELLALPDEDGAS